MLLKNAMALDPHRPFERVDIRIEGSLIVEVASSIAAREDHVLDLDGMIVMPGLVNAHTHSGQNLDRGVAPNMPLDLWMIWVVYGGIEISADDAYTLALAGALEMLATGCTAVLDHAWVPTDGFEAHSDAIMSAYDDAGIRAGLAPMIQDRDFFESMAGAEGAPEPIEAPTDPHLLVTKMTEFCKNWAGRDPRLTALVGPSAPQRCSAELMTGLADLVSVSGAHFHTHVLETKTQVIACRERYGGSVVDELSSLGLLGPRSSLAHCVWMDPREYRAVRDAGATIVHNPLSNLRCGSGLLPLGELLRGDVSVALGCDGAASNDSQNVFEAMKFASTIHTVYGDHTTWPQATEILKMTLDGGAAALGARTGMIREGYKADLVVLSTDRHHGSDKESTIRSLVYAERGESVRIVVVDGAIVMENGASTRVSGREVTVKAQALQQRIGEALGSREQLMGKYGGFLTTLHSQAEKTSVGIERRATLSGAF